MGVDECAIEDYGTNLVCSFGNCDRTADFGCTTTVDNSVIHDEISDHTEGIVQGTFGFVDDLVRRHISMSML